jgi:hypothetical protein
MRSRFKKNHKDDLVKKTKLNKKDIKKTLSQSVLILPTHSRNNQIVRKVKK